MLLSLQDAEPESNFAERVAQSRPPILLSHQPNVHTSTEERNHKFITTNFIRELHKEWDLSVARFPKLRTSLLDQITTIRHPFKHR
jgi:hypothetical protein